MQQLYQVFYRETGVRRFSELTSPRLVTFKGFPRNTVLHHLTMDDELFPDASKPYFQGFFKKLPLDLVFRSDVMVGNPRPAPFQPQAIVGPFVRQHREFRYIPNAAEIPTDDRTLVVLDYNALKHAYRFRSNPLAEWEKWVSFQRTMWAKINMLAHQSKKHHFVIVDAITDIPSFNVMANFGEKEGLTLARVFNTPEKLFVLNLFNWLKKGSETDNSVFRQLSKEALSRINLLFLLKDGRCSTLNLSLLYSWINGNENVSGTQLTSQYDDQVVRRAMLKYFLVLASTIPEDVAETIPEAQFEAPAEIDQPDNPDTDEHPLSMLRPTIKKPEPAAHLQTDPLKPVDTDAELPESLMSSVDEDLEILEQKSLFELSQRGLAVKGKELVDAVVNPKTFSHEEVKEEISIAYEPNEALKKKLVNALAVGTLNAAGYKKALADSEKYKKMPDPFGTKQSVVDRIKIDPSALNFTPTATQLKDNPTVFDKSMVKTTLQAYTSEYVSKHLNNDILKMVGALQKGGIIVQNHEVTMEHTVMGSAQQHRLELKPINGAASTIYFRLPVVEEDGTYKVAGNKYFMRKQRVDLPIRKISSTEVSLNSYYGKAFVSTENKMSQSESDWILKQINTAAFEGSDWITNVVPGDKFDSYAKVPYIYSMLGTKFLSFKAGDLDLRFDPDQNLRMNPPKPGARWCGYQGQDGTKTVWIDQKNEFFMFDGKTGMIHILGDIYKVLNLDPHHAPVRFSELAIFRKNAPVGVVLGYRLGWSKLLALLKVTPRFVEPRTRLNLEPHEYPIPFKNGTYVFSRKDKLASMILAGYMEYSKITKLHEITEFETSAIYLNLLSSKGLGSIYMREIDMMFDYFVDPITEEILQDIGEPTTFEGLLMRSSELLLTYDHPKNYDGSYTRIRGYERLAGTTYKELTTAVRAFRNKNIAGRSKIDISPWKVWQTVNEDESKMMVPDINPYQELKNDEGVTYAGEGGRGSDSMNKASRSFHPNDIGTISEATVDNKDVGVNIFTPASPNFKNLRGLRGDADVQNANRHSSVVLMAAGAMHDDANRINFISIQSSHVIAAEGYHAPYVRTGYESLVAQRMNPMFAYCAKEPGKVISLNDKGVVIEYKSGKKVGIELGRQFGRAEGSVYPFDIEPCVKMDQTFKQGDPISYNTAFFQYDPWNPGNLVMKTGLTAKTVLWETKQTHEDASAISQRLAGQLGTSVSYVRNFTVTFEQNIHHVVKPGQKVQPQDVLMSIEDEITSHLGSFGSAALETLKGLSKQSPRANYHGSIDRIEVFYHGDKDQMSDSLRKLADASDSFISEQAKATGKPKFTGRVTDDYRVEGTPLGINRAEIRFYITVSQNMGVADKLVFANQMKSVNSEVMDYTLRTEAGEGIDAAFGCRSIAARNVQSPYILGTSITLLKLFAKEAVQLYNS